MSVLPQLICSNAITIKIPSKLFCEYWRADYKMYMDIEKAYNSQGNLEEEEPSYESYIRYQDIAMEINTA